jgi:hypothetical protein
MCSGSRTSFLLVVAHAATKRLAAANKKALERLRFFVIMGPACSTVIGLKRMGSPELRWPHDEPVGDDKRERQHCRAHRKGDRDAVSEQLVVVRRSGAGRSEHHNQNSQTERAPQLVRRVYQPGGGASIRRGDAGYA